MTARRLGVAAALAAATLLASCAPPEAGPPGLGERVVVEQGELHGRTDGDVLRFRGIPFAAPPVGERRWLAPGPPEPWTGVREATEPGPRCPQGPAPAGAPHATAGSLEEDCLTLDVTVPAGTPGDARLPVLVWLHGGGFSAGSGGDVDPRRLVRAGPLVAVTLNYRLGALGFLGLPGLADSGSFGLLDQQQALRWVQRNAAAFGGDPDNVTLAGESAGADGACAQIAAPAAEGLFRRAVLQSGGCGSANLTDVIRPGTGPGGDTWKPLELVESTGVEVAEELGCPDPGSAAQCLRAAPVERLLGTGDTYWSPAVGTPTLPRRPSDLVADGELRPTPVLAGTTAAEGTLFTDLFFVRGEGPITGDRFAELLDDAAGRRAARARTAYPTEGRSPGRAWSDVITDRGYACPALDAYRAMGRRAPLFAYEFTDPSAPATFTALPPDLSGAATHGAEVAYLLDLVPGQPALDPAQRELADRMVAAWARFATTGDPSPPGGPAWPRWTGEGQITTLGPGAPAPRTGPEFADAHRCRLWTG
ncbi:carboxylesterase/lipase family protein [Pseudonocardia humida]|uniref:Carboxylic ester hydrolase n=1 Tax=Pseudonocardia humida TaxID=2800819 RepID=A0ABT0ZRT3_9PSEU|nr:carboxylesterase family protein [Pseudonocardia humida]MCO1653434.1 carboxylesterase family protein [Pseudonocardia humida]